MLDSLKTTVARQLGTGGQAGRWDAIAEPPDLYGSIEESLLIYLSFAAEMKMPREGSR